MLNMTLKILEQQTELAKKLNTPTFTPQIAQQLKALHMQWETNKSKRNIKELPFAKIIKERYNEHQQLKLMKYMSRVCEDASIKMLDDEKFAEQFLENNSFDAVILSLDIRRSTELMLKCDSPEIYAEFINILNQELTEAVKNRYGIYDKFTGDGLLAFFPDFYSDEKAIWYALLCATDCQQIFSTVFDSYKNHFDIGDMQTGIGVGLDTGNVFKAGEGLEYTVVGKPVVYACRFSAAPAGHIYLTSRAKDLLQKTGDNFFAIRETSIPIKHETDMQAFDVKIIQSNSMGELYNSKPSWL